MNRIEINKIHFPVTTLGFGRRVGIWFQGCSIRCAGCINRDTWKKDTLREVDVDALLESIRPWVAQADGVTISGGEPFDQPVALRVLLTRLRDGFAGDILVYSGYAHEKLFANYSDIFQLVDVLVSEPYNIAATQTLTLRGSDNQRIFLLSSLAHSRYSADIDRQPWSRHRRMDVAFDGDTLFMAGIPGRDQIKHLREELARRGLDCKTSEQNTIVRA